MKPAEPPLALMPSASEKLCRVCKKPMPAQGRKCTACNSFQDWWRILSFSTEILALLIAVFSLFGIAVPAFTKWWNRHSHTQVRIIGTSEEDLLVILMNTGHEPSTARRFRMSFVNVPLGDADLYPVDPVDLHIPAENSHVVRLRPRRFTPMMGNDIAAVTNALRGGKLKLTADISESTDERPIDISRRSDEYPTTDVSAWIKNYIPEV